MEDVLDRTDRRILAELAADARMSMTALADRVHLSRTAVLARVKRMEAAGVIRGYHAHVALPDQAVPVRAILLLRFKTRPCAPVLAYLRAQPEILQVWSVSGPHDAVVEAAAPDAAGLSALVDRLATSAFAIAAETRMVV
ncbi:Lrp/AsnC family transcriptional regulator [Caldimonas sp.]|uniref:Lrp/AsnC family transcriptional regulator n=1 Tax=Caldimonas sp. TaxID=2838790 RepID=UPI00391BEC19